MKRFLSVIFIFSFFMGLYAQEHLTFKNVPIDGHINAFVKKLESIGFKQLALVDNYALVEGDFGGEDRKVLILASVSTKVVSDVAVVLEESDSWHRLKSVYTEYKSLLASKYGQGISEEEFETPYYEGDGYETSAIKKKKCSYATFFNVDNGCILLTILTYDGDCCVAISYTDKINKSIAEAEETTVKTNDL